MKMTTPISLESHMTDRHLPIRTTEPELMRAEHALMKGKKYGLVTNRWNVDSSIAADLEGLYRTLWPPTVDGTLTGEDDPDQVAAMHRVIRLNVATLNDMEKRWLAAWPIIKTGDPKEDAKQLADLRKRVASREWPDVAAKYRLLYGLTDTPDGPDTPEVAGRLDLELDRSIRLPGDRLTHYFFIVHTLAGENVPMVVPEYLVTSIVQGLALSRGLDLGLEFRYRHGLLPLQ